MRVAVDPGHGMSNRQSGVFDPSATHIENGFKHEEAAIALKYGLALKDVFRSKGHDVFMTRDDAEDHAPVGMRAKNANDAGGKVFIALHLNDFDDDAANGQRERSGSSVFAAPTTSRSRKISRGRCLRSPVLKIEASRSGKISRF